MTRVPNQFPALEPQGPARVAIVLELPDRESAHQSVPLGGEAGRLLEGALGHVGIAFASCYVGNVSQTPAVSFAALDWEGEEIQSGIVQLRADLERFRPSIVLCLGNAPLQLFRHGNVGPRKTKLGVDWPSKVGSWRGSLFQSTWLTRECGSCLQRFELAEEERKRECVCGATDWQGEIGVKCLAAHPPLAILRDYGLQAYYRTGVGGLGDFERLREEMGTRELRLPTRDIRLCTDITEFDVYVRTWRFARTPVGVDIEGGPGNITSIAFALKADVAVVVPFAHVDGTSVWSESEETALWQAVKDLIEDPLVSKVAMHGTYDFFALAWTYGIVVRNWDDIEVSWWELFAELKKSLATQVSLLTREPFYKPDKEDGELKFESDEQFWRYNGLDAACTIECWRAHERLMSEAQRECYEFNRSLFPAVLYLMLRGIKFDKAKAKAAGKEAERGAMELQAMIDAECVRLGHWEPDLVVLTLVWACLSEDAFAQLVLRCLGGKNPRVKVEVVEERWQPMRWGGKKWVKDGKLVTSVASAVKECQSAQLLEEPPVDRNDGWWKPMHKTSLKLQPFTPASLSDCEPHILESKKAEWKRVKAIWKEMIHERKHTSSTGSVEACTTGNQFDGESCSSARFGELSTLLGLAVNIGSTNQGGDAQRFLYETCGLRRIYKDQWTGRLSWEAEWAWRKRTKAQGLNDESGPRHSADSGSMGSSLDKEEVRDPAKDVKRSAPAGKRLSTDQQALNKLYAASQDVRVLWCLQQRRLRLAAVNLDKEIDDDGRIRSSISLVKETGRMAASESPTGTGTNLQSWDKDHRHVCVADEGCVMGQCDLEGADSWTVAAECAALGDMKMLEDLRAGLKPAKGLCVGYFEPESYASARPEELRARLKTLQQPDWLYPGAKASTHGTSYGMGVKTMIDNVLKFSMADLPLDLASAKPVVLTKVQVEKLQGAFLRRYPGVKLWHEKTARLLLTTGVLEMSTGHRRRIYQRKAEFKQGRKVACQETLNEILASEPQYFTTLALKKMVARLWYDEENRCADGSLRVEILLCVHDSANTQWRVEEQEFAEQKHPQWFDNEMEIAGQKIVIPYSGTYGNDWGMKGARKL